MATADNELLMRFSNEAGLEIFQLLVDRSKALGNRRFGEILGALTGATAVCLANVLRPAVEQATDRAAAADGLLASCTRQARRFLEPVVAGGSEEPGT
jgi:hypothetical protein